MTEKKKNTLYVIGNGFDLCHDLDTSPTDFQHFGRNSLSIMKSLMLLMFL